MPDPIQGVDTSVAVAVATGQAGAAGGTQASAAASGATQAKVAAPVDQADVAATQNLLTTIIQVANDAPTIDEAKVGALQQSIANGTYQVDPMAIAKKLLGVDPDGASGGGGS